MLGMGTMMGAALSVKRLPFARILCEDVKECLDS